MAQNLVVGGDTYEGVERVAATNTEGETIVYPEGGDTVSNAVQYVYQTLKTEEKNQARKNIDALGQNDIYFRYNAKTYNGQTEHITTVTINVKKVVDGKEVVESVEIGTTTLYEHAKLHGYEGELEEFYDVLAKNMQTLKADGLELDPKENILYLTSGGKRIGIGVGMPESGSGDAVLYTEQTLTEEQKAQARENIKVLGRGDIVFTDGIGIEMVPGKPPVWTQSVVITAKSYDFDGTPILNEDGTQAEEEYTIDVTDLYTRATIWGFEGTRAEFFDALAKNMKSLKADGLEVDENEGSLFLLSGGERIGDPVPLGTGPQGPPGESGVTAPVNGFFTLSVDSDGNLWAHSAENGTTPDFEYDSETGNLYFVTEE